MIPWTLGNKSGELILSDLPSPIGDQLFAGHVNELRKSLNNRIVSVSDYGAVGDGMTDDSAAVALALADSSIIWIGDLDINVATPPAQSVYSNAVFIGRGSITGLYRKHAIPPSAASPITPDRANLVPSVHLSKLIAAASPVVVLVGDSISTYQCNQNGRSDLLSNILQNTLINQFPDKTINFYNRAIGGADYASLNAGAPGTPPANVLWWTDGAKSWLQNIQDLAPDTVFISFGMNDGNTGDYADHPSLAAIEGIVTKLKAFSKIPDIIFCTNMNPSMNPTDIYSIYGVKEAQESRDNAAGVTRSYALTKGYGLLDFHRQFCQVRDGFDPVTAAIMTDQESITGVAGIYRSTQECHSVRYLIPLDGTKFISGDGSTDILVMIGSQVYDWARIHKNGSGKIELQFTTGIGTDYLNYKTVTTTQNFPTDTQNYCLEVSGNFVCFYKFPSTDWGGYQPNLVATNVIKGGGLFIPKVGGASVGFDGLNGNLVVQTGIDRVNFPQLSDDQLFGRGNAGGSIYNHPGDFYGPYIYHPVINAYSFR